MINSGTREQSWFRCIYITAKRKKGVLFSAVVLNYETLLVMQNTPASNGMQSYRLGGPRLERR